MSSVTLIFKVSLFVVFVENGRDCSGKQSFGARNDDVATENPADDGTQRAARLRRWHRQDAPHRERNDASAGPAGGPAEQAHAAQSAGL